MTPIGYQPTRFDAHAFEGEVEAPRDAICSFCQFPRASIIHHPSRVQAAMAVVRRPNDEAETKTA